MKSTRNRIVALAAVIGLALVAFPGEGSAADIHMTATQGWISTPDGADLYMWSFTSTGSFRYPGSTIDVTAGEAVRVQLTNDLPDLNGDGRVDPVSMVFAGMDDVQFCHPTADVTSCTSTPDTDLTGEWAPVNPDYATASGDKGSLRSFAPEATPLHDVVYYFTPSRPGTFEYYSGTLPQKHLDMGLSGAMIVRPAGVTNQAYNETGTGYDHEFLQVYTSVDPVQHARVARGEEYLNTQWNPEYWFINGRSFPDTIAPDGVSYLPNQPNGALITLLPSEHVLMRLVNLGRHLKPMHHHGNSAMVVGLDGEPMSSGVIADGATAASADLAVERYTPIVNPGETVDTIFTWSLLPVTGMGWDVLGTEDASGNVIDPIPVAVEPTQDNPTEYLAYGETYSGSPYLGKKGALNPADEAVNINMTGEMYVPFHSHHEYELQNQNEGPGGALTLIAIMPPAP